MAAKYKRNFGTELKDIQGEPVRLALPTPERLAQFMSELPPHVLNDVMPVMEKVFSKPLTLSEASVMALTSSFDDETKTPEKDRHSRFLLACRVAKVGMVKINDAERDLIKHCLYKKFPDNWIAPLCAELLEGREMPKIGEDDEEEEVVPPVRAEASPPPPAGPPGELKD